MAVSDADVRARKAIAADVGSIVELNAALARELEGKSLDLARLRSGVEAVAGSAEESRGFYVVAEALGAVVGVLHVTYEWSPWRNATFWWLNNVFVQRCRRRQGAYRAMHRYVEGLARDDDGVCGIRLFTTADNRAAQRTYGSLGMTSEASYVCEIDFVL